MLKVKTGKPIWFRSKSPPAASFVWKISNGHGHLIRRHLFRVFICCRCFAFFALFGAGNLRAFVKRYFMIPTVASLLHLMTFHYLHQFIIVNVLRKHFAKLNNHLAIDIMYLLSMDIVHTVLIHAQAHMHTHAANPTVISRFIYVKFTFANVSAYRI